MIFLMKAAYKIAKEKHAGQKDIGGKDYIYHPLYVASKVKTPEAKVVALLHDIVEDTDMTLEDLAALGFPTKIVKAVDAVTKRKREGYFDYIDRVKKDPIATEVKIQDLKQNMDLTRLGRKPLKRDLQRKMKYQKALGILEGE